MSGPTRAQLLVLGELAVGTCWPSERTEDGWVQGRSAAVCVELGWATREYVGRIGRESGRGKIGGGAYLYAITDVGRSVLLAAVDPASVDFARTALVVLRDGKHARGSFRLGHDAEVRCACGWGTVDEVEVHGESGDDTTRLAHDAFASHIDEVVAAHLIRNGSPVPPSPSDREGSK